MLYVRLIAINSLGGRINTNDTNSGLTSVLFSTPLRYSLSDYPFYFSTCEYSRLPAKATCSFLLESTSAFGAILYSI